MNNDTERFQDPTASADSADRTTGSITVAKGALYVVGFTAWFFLGGFLSLGPRIAHNIDRAVGTFVLDGTFLTWAALPLTALVALIKPTKARLWAFGINAIGWLAFLASLYICWHFAYS